MAVVIEIGGNKLVTAALKRYGLDQTKEEVVEIQGLRGLGWPETIRIPADELRDGEECLHVLGDRECAIVTKAIYRPTTTEKFEYPLDETLRPEYGRTETTVGIRFPGDEKETAITVTYLLEYEN